MIVSVSRVRQTPRNQSIVLSVCRIASFARRTLTNAARGLRFLLFLRPEVSNTLRQGQLVRGCDRVAAPPDI